MKLVIPKCVNCPNKIQLDVSASNRSDLRQKIGGDSFYLVCSSCSNKHLYQISDVIAEEDTNSTVTGGIIGGIIGLIAGPFGLLIGAGLGAGLGSSVDGEEKKNIDFFNQSR